MDQGFRLEIREDLKGQSYWRRNELPLPHPPLPRTVEGSWCGLSMEVGVDCRWKLVWTVQSLGEAMEKVNLSDKLSLITEHWRPKVVGSLNGQEVKLVKFHGTFVWHHHDDEDELFLGVQGRFTVEFRDRSVDVGPGEFLIVPRGIEHRTLADVEAHVLLFEPAATRNTGNVTDGTFTAPNGVQI